MRGEDTIQTGRDIQARAATLLLDVVEEEMRSPRPVPAALLRAAYRVAQATTAGRAQPCQRAEKIFERADRLWRAHS